MLTRSFMNFDNSEIEPDFIYYDISVASIRTEETGINDPQVRFSETRTQPILSDCSKYNMSIIRFTMDGAGSDLPMWIPTIANVSVDADVTIYNVSVIIGGVKNTVPLTWTTEVNGASYGSSKYYFCYTYSHFCDIFNSAIALAVKNITATVKAPRLVYNGVTNLFSLYCDSTVWGTTAQVYFDANLYQLLRNFNNIYTPNSAPFTNEILIQNNLTNIFTGDDATKYIVMTQDYPSTDAIWSPVQSIVFTSSLIPIVAEQIGQPIIFSNNNNVSPLTSQAQFQQTITDIALPLQRSSDYKGFVEYAPNPYRMINLSDSKTEIRQIDISVFYKDRYGKLYPVTLANGASVSMKIMFRHKRLGI